MKELLRFLSKVLNSEYHTTDNFQFKFFSPFVVHRKKKLGVNLNRKDKKFGWWHCWISDEKGRNLFSLLKHTNKYEYANELKEILKSLNISYVSQVESTKKIITLPREFIPLSEKPKLIYPEYKRALIYAKKRNITFNDIYKHNIGYCSEGKYNGYLIIPSYDEDFKLNYFTGRSYHDYINLKHKNPTISKDTIIFDYLINWNEEINLCEAIFDAIAIKINAIPLLGKSMSKKLFLKILKKRPPKINIILDLDANNEALFIANELIKNNINTNIIKLQNKDPSETGYTEMFKKINTLENNSLDSYDILKQKLHEKN